MGTTWAVAGAAAASATTVAVFVVGVVTAIALAQGTHTHPVGMAPQYFGSPSPAGSDRQDRRRTNLWATCAYDVEICPQPRGPTERDGLVAFRPLGAKERYDGDGCGLFVPRCVSTLFEVRS